MILIFIMRLSCIFIPYAGLLRNSKFADDINNITNSFDKTTKLTFRNVAESQFIKFGSSRDRDPKLNIRSGQLKLAGWVNINTTSSPPHCRYQSTAGRT
jgi:hypothetical protein